MRTALIRTGLVLGCAVLLIVASVVIHEFGHVIMARQFGVQVLGHEHIVITEEDRMRPHLRPPDEMRPLLNQGLPRLVCRM